MVLPREAEETCFFQPKIPKTKLEVLFPAPDPENPPTSEADGHIWWHEYMSDEQKALAENVHDYYTRFNSIMLQAEIDAAKA